MCFPTEMHSACRNTENVRAEFKCVSEATNNRIVTTENGKYFVRAILNPGNSKVERSWGGGRFGGQRRDTEPDSWGAAWKNSGIRGQKDKLMAEVRC